MSNSELGSNRLKLAPAGGIFLSPTPENPSQSQKGGIQYDATFGHGHRQPPVGSTSGRETVPPSVQPGEQPKMSRRRFLAFAGGGAVVALGAGAEAKTGFLRGLFRKGKKETPQNPGVVANPDTTSQVNATPPGNSNEAILPNVASDGAAAEPTVTATPEVQLSAEEEFAKEYNLPFEVGKFNDYGNGILTISKGRYEGGNISYNTVEGIPMNVESPGIKNWYIDTENYPEHKKLFNDFVVDVLTSKDKKGVQKNQKKIVYALVDKAPDRGETSSMTQATAEEKITKGGEKYVLISIFAFGFEKEEKELVEQNYRWKQHSESLVLSSSAIYIEGLHTLPKVPIESASIIRPQVLERNEKYFASADGTFFNISTSSTE